MRRFHEKRIDVVATEDTGSSTDGEDRLVTVRIGKPLYPSTELDDEAAVVDLRDRTRAAVVEMLGTASSAGTRAESSLPLES